MATERERLEAAGRWLKEERERRGFPTAGSFARAIDADPSLVSRIESGTSKATDERAAKIAQVFGMDEIEVRRHLGLWVPTAHRQPADTEPTIEEMRYRFASNPHLSPEAKESIDALLRLEERQQQRARRRERRDDDEGGDQRETA